MKIKSILLQYRTILYIISPLILVYTIAIAIKYKEWRYLRERLGFYKSTDEKIDIWFHTSSVGEVNSISPLIHELSTRNPDNRYIITTGTPTGAKLAQKILPSNVKHYYLPLDFPGATKRFIVRTLPENAIIMETELWANLYSYCDSKGIPISIINARLSERTLTTNSWMYRLYAETLSHVSKILSRSETDANGFMTIGATSSKIKVIGNIKFAHIDTSNVGTLPEIQRPYMLAASTHEDEELQLAKLWLKHFSSKLLVIAPRHPDRSKKIQSQLTNIACDFSVRSKGDVIHDKTNIYLADTIGEMSKLINGADAVIMGGSFVPKGGHNVIEPARLGKLTIFGKSMYNFSNEAELLLNNKACIQVNGFLDVIDITKKIYDIPDFKLEYELNAEKSIKEQNNILERYIDAINEPCKNYQANTFL